MSTEVWFRNPGAYIREMIECGVYQVAWDRGYLVKRGIDPYGHALLHFGVTVPWRVLVVGEQGTAELDPTHNMQKPKAVYPTWGYGENGSLLEEIMAQPVGEEPEFCEDMSVAPDERPVFGQEHRVVITNLPLVTSGPGRQMLKFLKELQEEHPDCKLHVHGLYSWRSAFGLGFSAADVDPREDASKGRITLPNGSSKKFERAIETPQWISKIGFRPAELSVPRNRCMFNIKSAVWAGENYGELFNFTVGRPSPEARAETDTKTPPGSFVERTGKSVIMGGSLKDAKEGDMIACDSCSLADKCKYMREGAVCSVPGTDSDKLSQYFSTRDSGIILDGLGELMQIGAKRLERGLATEEALIELDPEVSKLINNLFEQGTKLAKLIDPALRSSPKVQVNVGGGSSVAVGQMSPQELVAGAIRELEHQGVRRSDITPDMIKGLLTSFADPNGAHKVIEATAIASQGETA